MRKRATRDLRISAEKPLVSPNALRNQLPSDEAIEADVYESRRVIRQILRGRDDRLIVVVGPCSIHDREAAVDFARKLRRAAGRLAEDLLIVMRVYFEKPRTVVGWKGLINDPGLDGSFRINDGLHLARSILLDVSRLGLPAANEFLDTVIGQYFAELVSWGCIGARTVESQVHRQLASGLSMPVGFKNRTDGNVQVAIEAMRAAGHAHWFPSLTSDGVPAILATTGNPDTHLVLRGGSDTGPNYHAEAVARAAALMRGAGVRPAVMVDCSHANSGKDPARQPIVARAVAEQVAAGERAIIGVMLESNLKEGRQEFVPGKPLEYGVSITDACLSWRQTLPVLERLAAAAQERRRHHRRRRG
ncbi:MAG: 3-deoxy-7-phosphoheptulonate synthase [Verrucomicrobia bacterium]|nr:MAG: 3-deoxy-7-phosphoheptulonate synthase [Verrucomicrobiota bacterium]